MYIGEVVKVNGRRYAIASIDQDTDVVTLHALTDKVAMTIRLPVLVVVEMLAAQTVKYHNPPPPTVTTPAKARPVAPPTQTQQVVGVAVPLFGILGYVAAALAVVYLARHIDWGSTGSPLCLLVLAALLVRVLQSKNR